MLKKIVSLFFSFMFGFGFWYLTMWMFTMEENPLVWSVVNKVIFLLLGIISTSTMDQKFSK